MRSRHHGTRSAIPPHNRPGLEDQRFTRRPRRSGHPPAASSGSGNSMRPIECQMPDLGTLVPNPVIAHYLLTIAFHGTGVPATWTSRAYTTNFIRIVDKAIYEYSQTRKQLQAYICSVNRTLLLMQAVNHLETCVNSLHRALRLFEQMKDLEVKNPNEQRQLRKLIKTSSGQIKPIRDIIEHIDEHVSLRKITEGQPIAIMLDERGIVHTSRDCKSGSLILQVQFRDYTNLQLRCVTTASNRA